MSKELKIDKSLDNSLKPVKVDGESTSIEISKNDVKVKNLLEAVKLIVSELSSGKVETTQISSGDDIQDLEYMMIQVIVTILQYR